MKEAPLIEEKLKRLIAYHFGVSESKITSDTRLVEDLEADWLDRRALILALEDEYWIEIPDEDEEKFVTVGDILTYLKEKVK
ncbi:MAG: acyl carrier protein [Deltaproteobacteria bacterium]|nr:MAG: acyl carrier protein [Deltaproteobacteria bacterium]